MEILLKIVLAEVPDFDIKILGAVKKISPPAKVLTFSLKSPSNSDFCLHLKFLSFYHFLIYAFYKLAKISFCLVF
jgi:hypothetical protein